MAGKDEISLEELKINLTKYTQFKQISILNWGRKRT